MFRFLSFVQLNKFYKNFYKNYYLTVFLITNDYILQALFKSLSLSLSLYIYIYIYICATQFDTVLKVKTL